MRRSSPLASEAGAGIDVIRGGAAKGALSDGPQRGLHGKRWQRAGLKDLPGETTLMGNPHHPLLHLQQSLTSSIHHRRNGENGAPYWTMSLSCGKRADMSGPNVQIEAKRRLADAGSAPADGRFVVPHTEPHQHHADRQG